MCYIITAILNMSIPKLKILKVFLEKQKKNSPFRELFYRLNTNRINYLNLLNISQNNRERFGKPGRFSEALKRRRRPRSSPAKNGVLQAFYYF